MLLEIQDAGKHRVCLFIFNTYRSVQEIALFVVSASKGSRVKILLESRGCKADYTTEGEPVGEQMNNLRCPLPDREWKISNGVREPHILLCRIFWEDGNTRMGFLPGSDGCSTHIHIHTHTLMLTHRDIIKHKILAKKKEWDFYYL